MKRILSLVIILIMSVSLLCSCDILSEQAILCKVNFYVDGELYETKTVSMGQTVSEPKLPEKENQIFVAWGTDGLISYKFDFSQRILGNMDLHAYFTIDAISLTNMITKETIKSTVTIKNKSYNMGMGGFMEKESKVSQGSGVVIDISDGYCYVLTNCHVVDKEDGFENQTISVVDPWGEVYEAKIYKSKQKSDYAMSEEYDLALIYFKYSTSEDNSLKEISMSPSNIKIGEYIVALGSPAGLQNAITYGQVVEYQPIKAESGSSMEKIAFDVVIHDAPIDHGSSGGALINTKGELIGINFAGYNNGKYGCAIPISKVIEFMDLYVY